MIQPRPLQLARMSGAQAQALTVIARLGTNRLFTPQFNAGADMMRPGSSDARTERAWRFSMRRMCSDDGAGPAFRCVRVAWNGATLFLRLPASACDDWLAVRLPDLQIDALPAQFIDAAWDAMVGEALRDLGLERLGAETRIMPEGEMYTHSEGQYTWAVSIRPTHAARAITAELSVADTGLLHLAGLLRGLPMSDCPCSDSSLSGLAVAVQAKVGMTMLDTAALRGLQVGDVVLLDCCSATTDGEICLTTQDGQGMRVRPCEEPGSRYVVTQEWNLLMDDLSRESLDEADDSAFGMGRDMQFDPPDGTQGDDAFAAEYPDPYDIPSPESFDTAPDPDSAGPEDSALAQAGSGPIQYEPESGNGLNVDRIPVRLTFDLGEQMLTLGELRRLQPGEYFDLQRRLDAGPLHIRANGFLVGTAELVDIEGRAGARILTLTLDGVPCR